MESGFVTDCKGKSDDNQLLGESDHGHDINTAYNSVYQKEVES